MNISDHETVRKADSEIWHRRLGLASTSKLSKCPLKSLLMVLIFLKDLDLHLAHFALPVKMICSETLLRSNYGNVKLLEIAHSEVGRPIEVVSKGCTWHFVTFINQASRWATVYPMKAKSGELECFGLLLVHAERATREKLNVFQSGAEWRGEVSLLKISLLNHRNKIMLFKEQYARTHHSSRTQFLKEWIEHYLICIGQSL